jgi:LacI family transcriptional regulator
MVTIRDVARVAGMSTQTVSRVINDRPNVAPQTRAHIHRVIAELGYAPDIIAKSLSSGRSNTVGVIGFGLEYFGSTRVLTGIEQKAREMGFSIILSLLDEYEIERVDLILQAFLSRRVEGVIWSIPGIGKTLEGLPEKLAQTGLPILFLNKEATGENRVVALNNRRGGQLATEHLLSQGYRHIGIVTGPDRWWETQQRQLGWQETLNRAGLDSIGRFRAAGDWSPRSGERALYRLLEQAPDLDAVFVSNDQMAIGVLEAARRLGLRVPQDLGVVGFDDIPEAAYFYPALTTVRQNAHALGAVALERLVAAIRREADEESRNVATTWIEPELVVRESSLRLPQPV